MSSDRVVVLRTFSKAWGLAGLCAGYAVAHARVIARLRARRGPYNLNAVAERVVAAALAHDAGWMRETARQAAASRDRLYEALSAMGLAPLPSRANFVLLPVQNALDTAAALLRQGVAVRPFTGLAGIGDAIRIGVGPWPMMERALVSLETVLQCA